MSYYAANADTLFNRYHSISSDLLHADWLQHLPQEPGLACDIGAGTGRDANWLAGKGWEVVAVEPERGFRDRARLVSHPSVAWLDDKLPDLSRLRKLNRQFNLILISAVWMHLPETKRERAFRILTDLLAPGGKLVISLRHSDSHEELKSRKIFPVSVSELEQFARARAVAIRSVTQRPDGQGRDYVHWETVVLEMPDDGTGSLPLLRHIIVNDDKASTYKLGLLRTLLRIADGAPGMVLRQTDDYVELPFGLVALYWIKLYMPLVLSEKLIQSPSHKPEDSKGLGFARPGRFYALAGLSPFDLRVGATFGPETAGIVVGTIRDVCTNILNMPANFITFPGQDKRVFQGEKRAGAYRKGQHWRIDKESLGEFGVFRVPLALWQCLSQYACWIEPAILNEWVSLMETYNVQYDRSVYDRAFRWEDSKRNTQQVREIASNLQSQLQVQGKSLECIWSGKPIGRAGFEIDHCFPWSRWFNNDLWNLLPTSRTINSQKRERLPSTTTMHRARDRILQWWEMAYGQEPLRYQFQTEAASALPLVNDRGADYTDIFDAMLYQRLRLRIDQQLVEWSPK
jgi:SAM-dependent methyltransferase